MCQKSAFLGVLAIRSPQTLEGKKYYLSYNRLNIDGDLQFRNIKMMALGRVSQ